MTNINKLQSVIAYVAGQRPGLGKLKLFKLLYLVDFTSHAQRGNSITGELYENFEMGPVPRTLWKQFDAITGGCVTIEAVPTPLGLPEQQMRPRASFVPDLDHEERTVIDDILAKFGTQSGNQLKALTHTQIPYLATQRGSIIPYGLAGYLNYSKPTEQRAAALRANGGLMGALQAAVRRRRQAVA